MLLLSFVFFFVLTNNKVLLNNILFFSFTTSVSCRTCIFHEGIIYYFFPFSLSPTVALVSKTVLKLLELTNIEIAFTRLKTYIRIQNYIQETYSKAAAPEMISVNSVVMTA